MTSTAPRTTAVLPLPTVFRFCLWAAAAGLAMGLVLGRAMLLAG